MRQKSPFLPLRWMSATRVAEPPWLRRGAAGDLDAGDGWAVTRGPCTRVTASEDQRTVKFAVSEPTWTWYRPGSTAGRPVPSMSAGVTASRETGNETWTDFDWPGSRATLANPTSRCGGT